MCSTGDENRFLCGFTKRRKARKQHVCCECGGPIPVGAAYFHMKGVWEEVGPDEVRWHLECDALWEFCIVELCGGEGGRIIGGLSQEIADYAYREQMERETAECGTDLHGILVAIHDGYAQAVSQ